MVPTLRTDIEVGTHLLSPMCINDHTFLVNNMPILFFFKYFYLFILERDRERVRDTGRGRRQPPPWEPD